MWHQLLGGKAGIAWPISDQYNASGLGTIAKEAGVTTKMMYVMWSIIQIALPCIYSLKSKLFIVTHNRMFVINSINICNDYVNYDEIIIQ